MSSIVNVSEYLRALAGRPDPPLRDAAGALEHPAPALEAECEAAAAGLDRRDFLRLGALAGGGLVLGVCLPLDALEAAAQGAAKEAATVFAPNAFVAIDTSGTVTVVVARSELGQGARTVVPMMIAEELEADWSRIRIEPALADRKYGNMTTGGSTTVRTGWEPLRKAGATAREMLIDAGARTWHVERGECRAENGAVVHVPSHRRLDYGQLVTKAAELPVPENAPLKKPGEFRIVGTSPQRLDGPDKVRGRAEFGIDVRRPGMLRASIARCPAFGGKVASFDAAKSRAVPGVVNVLEVPTGVAVLAETTWAALQGRRALEVKWDLGPNAGLDSKGIRQMFDQKSMAEAAVARKEGDATAALARAGRKIEAVYEMPFLAHATLEPMNCTAEVRADGIEIWAPTQAPTWAQGYTAQVLGVDPQQVRVHTTLSGGGFGRRAMPDFVIEAAQVAKAAGKPVQVVWTREDDMQHDWYRPASQHRLSAGLDERGDLVAWSHRVVAPSITEQLQPGEIKNGLDEDAMEGAANVQYAFPNFLAEYVMANTAVPVGWWRSVYNSQNPFVTESFLDEVAAAMRRDPVELRLRLLHAAPRMRSVVECAAEAAGWGKPLPAGRARGIACNRCFGSDVAQVAEVSVDREGLVTVHRVVAAIDCGIAVHPDLIAAQTEGGIAYALGAMLHGEITIEGGRVRQSSFDDYDVLRMREMPEVEVHVVPSTEPPGGIGEPGLPPLAPAVGNAIFAATGVRLRRLPIRREDLRRG